MVCGIVSGMCKICTIPHTLLHAVPYQLRAIPDKNQKILNGAGHSWSQIFMKLSEHVKVVTLSKYSTLFFSQHARLPWQPDTKILAFRSAK